VTTELASARTQAPAGGGGTLTGTGGLLRFLLRRDRIKLPAWTLGIAVFTIYYAMALPEIFRTEEDLRSAAAFTAGPIGALIGGPGYGFDDLTIPRFLVGVYGLYFLLAAALMNILLVTRHTRVEEQTGRAELVRANVVGRHAPLTATLILAVITNALLTVLMFGGLVASDLDVDIGGAAVFAASLGAEIPAPGTVPDLVINATSASLSGEVPGVPASVFADGAAAYDLAYRDDGVTPFTRWAAAHGSAAVHDGWGMLVEQAAESWDVWFGVRPDTGPLRDGAFRVGVAGPPAGD
jgi:ABC-2 type transport system permease protein